MKHQLSRMATSLPVRWGLVTRVILAVLAAIVIALVILYVVAFTIPEQAHANLIQKFDDLEIQNLAAQMLRIETNLHISSSTHA